MEEKEYRKKIGFKSQRDTKKFFSGKDIFPEIDYKYISLLNERVKQIIKKIHSISVKEIKPKNLNKFYKENITDVFKIIKKNNILKKLNNLGRRPEQVYFSWLRGYVVLKYYLKALSYIFDIGIEDMNFIGKDNLKDIKTFRKSPTADLEVVLKNNKRIRLEVQSGFQGINDIKLHKFKEAKKILKEKNIETIVIHFDFFNGEVAFVKLKDLSENDKKNWIVRTQMEGQMVFNIDKKYFVWKLTQKPFKFVL